MLSWSTRNLRVLPCNIIRGKAGRGGSEHDFELTVSREVAMWKRGVAEVDVNREAPARAPPQVSLD